MRFTVVTEPPEGRRPDEAPFDVVFHDQGVSVYVNFAYEAIV
ncbi:hypothetical protein [Streptomyces sp. NPDC054797]